MAVYFQLFQNGEAQVLTEVDREMCKHFNVFCDPDLWYQNWYNTIGFSLALGHTWEQIYKDWPNKKDIIDWIKQNYSPNSFSGR